ncbi:MULTISPECIES: thioredoxin family protein [Wenyingzhuangia]|uniref:Thioredoxin n=2 Tax=Wenyingzhuangia TaxID=1518147 RepID=A0A1M5UCS0_9FLAO|nr:MULTISPECIES: thioredoxin family protein [Wenyingzhuangia]MDO3694653.1 thioredoxin family protein [Wenyingzhuangia sp. chi5]GGF68379.1 thiol reductase thioredoxin [Wenyingzhuangia marina]SHH60855.1 Thioredoxin [Wenyingzhuangia marina]
MKELTTDTLQEEVNNNSLVFVQFSAGWCGNCRIMKPKFKKFSTEVEGAEFIVIDAEKNPESRKLANVNNLPTFAAFKNGELVNQTQTNKADVLKSFIDEIANN